MITALDTNVLLDVLGADTTFGPRSRVVADFLVGAHASVQADRLLTRDRGFHRAYFGELTILDPTG